MTSLWSSIRHRCFRNVFFQNLGNSLKTGFCLFRIGTGRTELGIQFFELLFAQQPRGTAARCSPTDRYDIVLLFVIENGAIRIGGLFAKLLDAILQPATRPPRCLVLGLLADRQYRRPLWRWRFQRNGLD